MMTNRWMARLYWRDTSGGEHLVGSEGQLRATAEKAINHTLSFHSTPYEPSPNGGRYVLRLYETGLECLFTFGNTPNEAALEAIKMQNKAAHGGGR